MAGNDKFRRDIKRFISKSNTGLDKYARKVVIEIYSRVVLKSPVDTGRFRANWQVGNGSINSFTSDATDLSGAVSISKAAIEVNTLKINGQTIYVSNALPYAYRLEYEGWSLQSPQGMTRTTLAEMNGILQGAAREVKQ